MYPSESKTKQLQRALVPVFGLIALALYAPYTDAYTRQDVVEVALVVVAVIAIVHALGALVKARGTPIVDVRTYPCGSTVQAHGWELAGLSHLPHHKAGCPTHRRRCPSDAQNQG